MRTVPTFELTDPLPQGVTVLEASAGTGKTYAIAALTARFLAEGVARVDDLLLVTFSRAATAELRLRVRARLRDSARSLRAAAAGGRVTDAVDVALVAGRSPTELLERSDRLAAAFAGFDRATIMTTHEFCSGMLRGLGILAPQTPQSVLVEDLAWLADEVSADLYVRRYADAALLPPFPYGDPTDDRQDPGARAIARAVVGDPARLEGVDLPDPAGQRAAFAADVRAEVERRKADLRVYSFDDQLTRLADALADPVSGPRARARLADRFPVVLVDEFQDTDPVQWSVLERAFAPACTVVLIGDPKQAIYGFRGGDVHLYTRATRRAGTLTTLRVNHRSDAGVVDAVSTLFRGVALGDEIDVPDVRAAHPARLVPRRGTAWERGIQLRVLESDQALTPWHAGDAIGADLVGVVAELVGEAPPLARPGGGLRPRDIAVLVRSNGRGQELASALVAAGIPATFTGTSSVFASRAAEDWLTLLRALDRRRRPYLQRAYLTDFVGASVRELATADDGRVGAWAVLVHRWARVVARGGIPALLAAIEADTDFSARLLGRADGERLLTDHRHLGELLHQRGSLGAAARPRELAAWLAREIDGPGGDLERTRRLETDADAVQLLTIHRAKGLQWPVVLLPEAATTRRERPDVGHTLVVPGPDGRVLDVGGRRAPGRAERWDRSRTEDGDEELRALYVGLTRAESHVVAWWAHHWNTAASPLHRLLHAAHDPEHPTRPAASYPTEHLAGAGSPRLIPWLMGSEVAVTPVEPPTRPGVARRAAGPTALAARPWSRAIDHDWRRTSYSGLTAQAHDLVVSTDATLTVDEPEVTLGTDGPDPRWLQPSPLADFPAGATFGSLVHAVYEHVDATGAQWRTEVARACATAQARWPVPGVDAAALASALEPSLTTPLGPWAPGAALRDFGPSARLNELDFEFPLSHPTATVADLARLLAEHLPASDPLAAYPGHLAHPQLAGQRLHGFLTGSIDTVLRLADATGRPGFVVVDYKTNRLGVAGEPLTVGHYTPAAMAQAMMASHYPLQALLYCVALHRFLGVRLAGYSPERDLAGVAYLFVRGMAGPETPTVDGSPLGVFRWNPPTALVLAVSRLLAGGPQ